jgi:hypothetical protein
MLPGILSLRPKSKESADASADKVGEDEEERDEAADVATDEVQVDVATKFKAPSTSTLLGRMEGLSTDTPVLKIPYPNGGCLTFQGHKVNDSTSRFMMLSFKKGDVVCKDAVSSIIVFGESTYSGPECTDVVELDELTSYGGSERTIDGGKAVKVKKGTRPVVKTARLTQLPTEIPSQAIKTPFRKSPKAKVLVPSDVGEDDSDAYLDKAHDVPSNQTVGSARRSSRRSPSSKVSYAVDEDEEDGDDDVEEEVDDEPSSDDDGEESNSKKLARKRTPAKPKAALNSDSDIEMEDKPSKPTRKRGPAKPKPVLASDSEEEEKSTKPTRKRAPAKQKPVLDSDFEEEEEEKPSNSTRKRAPTKQKPMLDSDLEKEGKEKPSKPIRKRAPAKPKPVLDSGSDKEKEEKPSKSARKRAPAKLKSMLGADSDKKDEKTPSKAARKRAPVKPKPVLDIDSVTEEEEEKTSKSTRKRAPGIPQVVIDVDDSEDEAAANPIMKATRTRGTRSAMPVVDLQDDEFEPPRSQRSVRRSTSKKSKFEDAFSLNNSERVDGSNANGKTVGSGNDGSDDDGYDDDYSQECNKPSARKKATSAATTRQALFTVIDVDESPTEELNGNSGSNDGVKENEPPKKRNRTSLAPSREKSSALGDKKSKSPVSRSVIIASPRSRRRRKPGVMPTSPDAPQPQVDKFKSNADDEYGTFDFSADDVAILSTPEKRVKVKARS